MTLLDKSIINLPISSNEVPDLRESNGWDRRDKDYPVLFHRCNFWAEVRAFRILRVSDKTTVLLLNKRIIDITHQTLLHNWRF